MQKNSQLFMYSILYLKQVSFPNIAVEKSWDTKRLGQKSLREGIELLIIWLSIRVSSFSSEHFHSVFSVAFL